MSNIELHVENKPPGGGKYEPNMCFLCLTVPPKIQAILFSPFRSTTEHLVPEFAGNQRMGRRQVGLGG